ncbi:hypothetical protein [Pseudokineococcus sp. 1T1Z-3]|uniref:hypothetical protein n=1 Tax=Pseudokineococcus sp. 1T1Z-3 TaxID=3132745 RepID=UPI0030D9F908
MQRVLPRVRMVARHAVPPLSLVAAVGVVEGGPVWTAEEAQVPARREGLLAQRQRSEVGHHPEPGRDRRQPDGRDAFLHQPRAAEAERDEAEDGDGGEEAAPPA